MSDLKIGVYAFGRMGKNHARVLGKGTDVFDIYQSKRDEARELGYNAHENVNSFLNAVDAAIIATPSRYHLKAFEECIEDDKHVIIEKPVAPKYPEALKIKRIADSRPELTVMVNHTERFNPVIRELKKHIQSDIKRIDTTRYGPSIPDNRDIRSDGVINDLAVHDIDIVKYLMESNPYRIRADVSCDVEMGYEETAHIDMLYTKNKAMASINVSWGIPSRDRKVFVATEKETLSADLISQTLTITKPFTGNYNDFEDLIQKSRDARQIIEGKIMQPLEIMISEFKESVKNKTTPPVTVDDGLYTAKVIDLTKRSHARELSF